MKYSYLCNVGSETEGSCQARQNLRSGLRKFTPCPGSKNGRSTEDKRSERAPNKKLTNLFTLSYYQLFKKGDLDYGNESKGSGEAVEV
jgi:hypothetical protein